MLFCSIKTVHVRGVLYLNRCRMPCHVRACHANLLVLVIAGS